MMSARLTLSLLGQTTILLDGQPVTGLTSRTAEALLIYLVCEQRPFLRPWLADFFWDERSPQQAATNLRTVLSMLRKALGDFLLISRESVAFNQDAGHWLDVAEFEERWSALEPGVHGMAPLAEETVSELRAVLDLYQGNFLAGYYLSESRGFEEWTLLTQERLRRQATVGLRRLAAYYLDTGQYEPGIRYAGRLLALDPYDENVRRQMMWLLARSGQRHAALQQYHAGRRLLAAELGVEPSPVTSAAVEEIQALSWPPPCRLPVQPGPFVGREAELFQVGRHLSQSSCRLLSILGPGGMGKTRLALEAAHRCYSQRPGQFLDGVYFIPLAATETAGYLPLAFAESLGFTFRGAADPADQLVNYLRQKELLLVLDNFEHLLAQEDAAGPNLLARILAEAPRVKMLVTTRHRLNLVEEWLFDLAGLGFPDRPEVSEPESYGAVRLFLQNARRLHQAFAPAAEDWAAIIRLCQLLEGMPLGLELAAAWVRQLSCAAIVNQVEQRPASLATSYHNVPSRHRSLTAVFAHSWDLLTATEQAVFRRLAVFRGGFTAEAAMAVSGAGAAELAALADKSLLRLDPAAGRYDMHNLLRQFAAEKLHGAAPPANETVAEHGRFFASLLGQKENLLGGAGEKSALDEFCADLPNLRAAWSWAAAVAGDDPDPLAAMVHSLAYLHDVQGLYLEGANLFQEAAERLDSLAGADAAGREPLARQLGRILTWLGRFLYHVGRYEEARHSLQTATDLLRPLQAQAELALALTNLGEVARFENDFPLAQRYQAESLALARAAASTVEQSLALLHLGKIHVAQGQYEEARPVYLQGLALCRQAGSLRQIALFEDNLGTVALELGDYEVARQKFEAGYQLRQALDDRWGLAVSVNNLGVLASATGAYEQAEEKYRQAATWFRHMGHRWGVAQALTNLGNVLSDRGDYEAATSSLRQALHLWQELGSQLGEGDVLFYLGQVARYRGAYPEAKSFYEKSLALFAELNDDRQTAIVWRDLGVVLARMGELPAARRYLRQSLELAVQQKITPDVLYALSGWAEWYTQQGQAAAAVPLLSLVSEHPLTRQQEKEEARELIARLSPALSAPDLVASQEMGGAATLDEAVRRLLA